MDLMPIALDAFSRARSFYKGQVKSANKRYDVLSDRVSNEKWLKRHINQELASRQLNELWAYTQNFSYEQKGNEILSFPTWTNPVSPVGNCTEMSCVAIALLRQRNRDVEINVINVGAPGDHCFFVVGYLPPSPTTVHDLCHRPVPFGQESWAVDVWANVCCEIQNYPAAFTRKMQRWHRQQKKILNYGVNPPAWEDADTNYVNNNVILGLIRAYPA